MHRFAVLLLASLICVTLAGCVVLAPQPREPVVVAHPGPPPHAPAHGYRRKHQSGAELRFDSQLGVYLVLGHPDVYFYDDWFIRLDGGTWQVSARLGGPWKSRAVELVPPGLRSKHHAKKSKRRGRGAARIAW